MKILPLLLCCALITTNSLAQLQVLQKVQQHRTDAKWHEKHGDYDGACVAMRQYITDDTYANFFDYLKFSYSSLKTKDTVNFENYLRKGIAAGADSVDIFRFVPLYKFANSDKDYLNHFFLANYEPLHIAALARYDTGLINELHLMNDLDQLARKDLKFDSNLKSMMYICRFCDSINYQRVVKLLEADKFIGYHNCGAAASKFLFTLMHTTDYDDVQWQYVFKKVKEEVLKGNIMPDEVAILVDRHYSSFKTNPCSYYGHWARLRDHLCDCDNVDKLRAEIGLESLRAEYEREKIPLPKCYNPR